MNPTLLIFAPFANVTIAPVLFCGKKRHELRLYLPKRIELANATIYARRASDIFDATVCPPNVTRVATLEYNRAGMCFCIFVEPTPELVNAINMIRKDWKLRPCQL